MVVMGGCRNASSDSLKNASSRSSCGQRVDEQCDVGTITFSLGSDTPQPSVDVFRHA
jgi:hypothetical protein